MELWGLALPSLGDFSAGTFVVLIVLLILSDRLVWHGRLTKVEKQRDRWEGIALTALGVADKMTVQAEVTNEIITRLPDPAVADAVAQTDTDSMTRVVGQALDEVRRLRGGGGSQ